MMTIPTPQDYIFGNETSLKQDPGERRRQQNRVAQRRRREKKRENAAAAAAAAAAASAVNAHASAGAKRRRAGVQDEDDQTAPRRITRSMTAMDTIGKVLVPNPTWLAMLTRRKAVAQPGDRAQDIFSGADNSQPAGMFNIPIPPWLKTAK